MLPSVVEELKKEVAMAQAALEQKEKENADLREQVKEQVARWSEYEIQMKSMEETWQKQMAALQVSLSRSFARVYYDINTLC